MNYLFPPKLELNCRAARIYSPELSSVQPSSKYDHEQLPSNNLFHIKLIINHQWSIAGLVRIGGLDWIGLDSTLNQEYILIFYQCIINHTIHQILQFNSDWDGILIG